MRHRRSRGASGLGRLIMARACGGHAARRRRRPRSSTTLRGRWAAGAAAPRRPWSGSRTVAASPSPGATRAGGPVSASSSRRAGRPGVYAGKRQGRLVDDGFDVRRRRPGQPARRGHAATGRAPPPTPSMSTAWRSTTKAASCSTAIACRPLGRHAGSSPCCAGPPTAPEPCPEQRLVRVGSMSMLVRALAAIALLAVSLQPAPARAPPGPKPADRHVRRAGRGSAAHSRGQIEQRDIVMVIEPYQNDGLRVRVAQRDPGRRPARRAGRQVPPRRDAAGAGAGPRLLPGAGSATTRSHRRRRRIRSRATRCAGAWSRARRSDLLSFAILEDGTFELQVFRRRPIPDGMARLEFERIVDGELVRQMTGQRSGPTRAVMPLARRPFLGSRLAAAGLAASAARAEEARYVTIATGSVTGTYYPVGTLIASLPCRARPARAPATRPAIAACRT